MQRAQVVVLAGPSGAGKSRLAERLGLPILRLDDFYKDGDDPTLPRITHGANAGLVDWDDPASWHRAGRARRAARALRHRALRGAGLRDRAERPLPARGSSTSAAARGFVAEGIFAPEVVAACRDEGMLAAAYCITQHPVVTFWRRLTRDLREHRKPPLVLAAPRRRPACATSSGSSATRCARAAAAPRATRRTPS